MAAHLEEHDVRVPVAAEEDRSRPALSRRDVVRGAAVSGLALPVLAACGTDTGSGTSDTTSSGGPTGGSTGGSSGGTDVTVPTSDVPVGSGTIVKDAEQNTFVVTQPAKGDFKAFSGICTHQKCPVTQIDGAEIVCTCHGSRYAIADGSVVQGPAPQPLPELTATVEGGEVVVTG